MEQFTCNTRIVSGPGATQYLKTLQIRRLFLVADPFFVKSGKAAQLCSLCNPEASEIFHEIQPDPTVRLAAAGTAQLRQFQPDTVVALGGGSALDCAKAMVYFAELPVRLVAIPTTSGSGSEMTDFAILTHEKTKHPLIDPRLRPELAILDSDYLTELPRSLIADTGFDALSHAVEAFVATGAGTITDALAADAFCTVFGMLPASFGGNTAVRARIHMASAMAAMAFNQAGLGLCHALSHSLGSRFHVPHGRLNAILLPEVIRCNAHSAGEKYAALARRAGLIGSANTVAVRNLCSSLIRLRQALNLPDTLSAAGISPDALRHQGKEIVAATLADPCCASNPQLVEDFMVRRILEAVMGHG